MLLPQSVLAAPVVVDYEAIQADTFEDFEQYTVYDLYPLTVTFEGFQLNAALAINGLSLQIVDGAWVCGVQGDNCLVDYWFYGNPRVFTPLDTGAKYLGFELSLQDSSIDTYRLDVEGVSGSLTMFTSVGGYYAFGDNAGLISVSVLNLGHSRGGYNFGLDDVIVGRTLRSVPEPPFVCLLLFGLAALSLSCSRRLRWAQAKSKNA